MSKSHKQNAQDRQEKKTDQTRKSGSKSGTATQGAGPVTTQELTEGSFTPIPANSNTKSPLSAAKSNHNRMSQPQQQQKPQPQPHPQQTEQSWDGKDGIKSN